MPCGLTKRLAAVTECVQERCFERRDVGHVGRVQVVHCHVGLRRCIGIQECHSMIVFRGCVERVLKQLKSKTESCPPTPQIVFYIHPPEGVKFGTLQAEKD